MTEIERAQTKAMKVLSDWVDALQPRFNAVEMQALKQRLTAAFREYEFQISDLKDTISDLRAERVDL